MIVLFFTQKIDEVATNEHGEEVVVPEMEHYSSVEILVQFKDKHMLILAGTLL